MLDIDENGLSLYISYIGNIRVINIRIEPKYIWWFNIYRYHAYLIQTRIVKLFI